jgi:hypothetical protein
MIPEQLSMSTDIPAKLLQILEEIDERGSANLTRLTVLKKWFERPTRLSAFAVWVATRALVHKGKTGKAAAGLFREARALLTGADRLHPKLHRQAAQTLHDRLCDFQNEYQRQRWGPVRIIRDWNLMLVEHGLAIYLWHPDCPSLGYKLAADYCQHYDWRHPDGLSGPSRTKIKEIVRFMVDTEAWEK